jgi:hypothetical protein
MKAAVLASLVASAAAFAPSSMSTSRSSTSVAGAMDSMEGSIDFRGKEFKLLAVVGFIVPDFVRIPGDIYSFEHVPHPSDAHEIMIKDGPLTQLLLWVGLWELIVTGPACSAMMNGEREPGCTFPIVTQWELIRVCIVRFPHPLLPSLPYNRLRLDVVRAQGRCRQEEDGRLRAPERAARYDCRRYVPSSIEIGRPPIGLVVALDSLCILS